MLKNYFLTAFRSLMRSKLYSLINLLGLSVGVACCVMMTLFVQYELNYDQQFENSDKVVRIQVLAKFHSNEGGTSETAWPRTGAGWKPLLEADFSEVEAVGRLRLDNAKFTRNDFSATEAVYFADKEIFEIFDFTFLEGSATSVFNGPNSIVLLRSTAEKYFGNDKALGKHLVLEDNFEYVVSAVIEDLPSNTHLENYSFINVESLPKFYGDNQILVNLTNMNFFTYLLLDKAESIETIENRLDEFSEKHFGALLRQLNAEANPYLIKLKDIHLYSRLDGDMKAGGDINQVYLFATIALLILLVASINYMNLATARASQRAKEVGVRKALGVTKVQLVGQFLVESILLSFFAVIVAMAIVEVCLPLLADFMQRDLTFNYLAEPWLAVGLFATAMLIGVISGSYPAFYLSSFAPAKVLKGDVSRGKKGQRFREVLVVIQFGFASLLIVSTIIVSQQMKFVRDVKLGYDKSRTLVLYGTGTDEVQKQFDVLKNELEKLPFVEWTIGAQRFPTQRFTNNDSVRAPGQDTQLMAYNYVSASFFQNLNISLLEGRYFNSDNQADYFEKANAERPNQTGNVIVNESGAKLFGWSAKEAVGKTFDFSVSSDGNVKNVVTIVGVVEDYVLQSARDEIKPLVHAVRPERFNGIGLKISQHSIPDALASIESIWEALFPSQTIYYEFLEESYNSLYQSEERMMTIYQVFSVLTIIVACLGLFGLASFTTSQRVKEIGIRKVLGASVANVVVLLSGQFAKLVLIASIISWPIAFYLMSDWLSHFSIRIDLSFGYFIVSTFIGLFIAGLTVSSLAYNAATSRPVKSLRYE